MIRKALSFFLSVALSLSASPQVLWAQAADPEVAKGIAQVESGDYDSAILMLDTAARRLATDPARSKDLSQAYLYLGIAYVGKGHEAAAKAKFREALGQIKDLSLSPDKFPPKVIDIFESAKEEARNAPAPAPPKKGGGKGLWIGAGVVAAGAGVAAAAGGGGKSSATTTTLPRDARKVDVFSGTLCCNTYPDNYHQVDIVVGGTGVLDADITWTSSDTNKFFGLGLQDDSYTDVAQSNRATNSSSHLTANVSPRTSSAGAAYHLIISFYNNDATTALAYTLTVKHP